METTKGCDCGNIGHDREDMMKNGWYSFGELVTWNGVPSVAGRRKQREDHRKRSRRRNEKKKRRRRKKKKE